MLRFLSSFIFGFNQTLARIFSTGITFGQTFLCVLRYAMFGCNEIALFNAMWKWFEWFFLCVYAPWPPRQGSSRTFRIEHISNVAELLSITFKCKTCLYFIIRIYQFISNNEQKKTFELQCNAFGNVRERKNWHNLKHLWNLSRLFSCSLLLVQTFPACSNH